MNRSLVLLVTLVAFTAVASAQTPSDTVTLAPITVTATRLPVEQKNAPAAITVITGEELRARGITRLTDALRAIPSVSVVPSGSFGSQTSVFLRGGESDYTKVLVDGVPLNDAGGAIDLAHLAVTDVDRIEVVRGPASVLWGSDAVTGVIQIFTNRANTRSRLDLSARGGTYATREASGNVAFVRGALGLTAGGASNETDGVLDFNNQYRNRQASAALQVGSADRQSVRAMIRHSDATFHYPTDFLGTPVDSNQYRREKRTVASVEAHAPLYSRLTGRVLLGANELDGISDNQVDRPNDFAYHDESEASRRVADGRIDIRLPVDATLTTGAEWTRERESNTSNFDASRLNRGYYAQLLAGTSDAWLLTVGGRVDDNEKFGTFTTGRAAGSWRSGRGTRLRASFGTAFKEPAFSEIFNTSFTRGNSSLQPERSRSVEVSVEQEFLAGRGTSAVTWFDQRFRDRVDFISFPPDSAVFGTFANIGQASASGVELEARATTRAGIGFSASYTYLDTEITEDEFGREGQRLLRRPAHSAAATLSYARGSGSIAATLHRVGSRHDVGYVLLPWYTTVDFGGELHVLRRADVGLVLTARIENAFDYEYETIANYPAPGRTVLVGARLGVGR